MASRTCSCKFKEQMIAEMTSMRVQSPGKNTEWVDLLFADNSGEHSLCCLLTFLLYYGYCKECPVPLSEQARTILSPLMAAKKKT